VCKADDLQPSCAVVTKSGNLNFLEPSGPVQACNGTALPLPFLLLNLRRLWGMQTRVLVKILLFCFMKNITLREMLLEEKISFE